jgi:hypothetical protein
VAELVREPPSSLAPHRVAQRRVGGQPQDGRGETGDVARFQQDPRLGQHHLPRPVDVVADHRAAGQQRLRQNARQALPEARVDHAVEGSEKLGDAAGGDEADEVKRVPQPHLLGRGDQPVAQHAVADEHETDLRVRREDRRRGGQDVVVPLPLEEPGHRPEGDLVVGQPELTADLVPGTGGS